ncbi:MAG: hypothetical protein GTN76_07520 [Candidatus Aenigmarchaeota archaeon]|nr:hypothetical protein [Candidatus Aenigmarchaeota archaeon]NIO86129.1 hypothetical protein [Candidatus Aminicenantes bacterium]
MAYEKPNLMAKAMARTDPNTEPIPLTPHIRGTYCVSPISPNNVIARGKGIPMKNPRGDNNTKDINILE